jgi:hypothetical protein
MAKRIAIADRKATEKTVIVFSFKVPPALISPLLGFIDLRRISLKDEKARQEQIIADLGGDVAEAYVYERTDALGNKKADSGNKIWDNGKAGHRMSFPTAVADLTLSGYQLNNVYSTQNDWDKMAKLVFQFEQQETKFPGKAEFMQSFENLCKQSWLNTHLWDNPVKGTVTINPANSYQPKVAAPALKIERTTAKAQLPSTGQDVEREGIYFFCSNVILPEVVEEVV